MDSKGKRVMTFFKSQLLRWGKEVRTVLANLAKEPEVDPCLAVILTMMVFFNPFRPEHASMRSYH
jgi:hypothetical protein